MMKLFIDIRSPPVRSCLMLIDHLKIKCDFKYIDLFKGEQLETEFIKINPAHTVPVLLDNENQLILRDSHSILMYLCDKTDNSLFPKENNARIKVIDKLMFESSILFRRDSDFMSEIIQKGFENCDLQRHQRKILETFSILEQFLCDHKYMALNSMTIADFSIVCTLSTVNILIPINADVYPKLHEWFNKMILLECYKCNQHGLEKLKIELERYGKFEIKK